MGAPDWILSYYIASGQSFISMGKIRSWTFFARTNTLKAQRTNIWENSDRFNCVRGTRTQPLICALLGYRAINKGGFFVIAFVVVVVVVVVVDTHLRRFEALAYVLPHFDALTHLVIRVSSAFIFQTFAEVCYSVFVNRSSFKSVLNFRKAYIFKSLLKVYYRSVFNESSKAFIFQKCAESLHPE